jgi:hypothetical protein
MSKISTQIQSQMPDFVKSDHPQFILFVEAYYRWLESDNQILDRVKNLTNSFDIDRTSDEFLEYFFKQFLPNIPREIHIRDNILLKEIKDFYRAKGTEKSYQFFFRAFFDKMVSFYYPGEDILRVDDGKWIRENSFRTTIVSGDPFDLIGKTVTGSISGETVFIERVIRFSMGNYHVYELFFSPDSASGDFELEENLSFEDTVVKLHWMFSAIEFSDTGRDYAVGDFARLSDSSGSGARIKIVSVDSTGGIDEVSIQDPGIDYYPSVEESTLEQRYAAQFVAANSEYLTIADNASLSFGDETFTFTGWIKFDDVLAQHTLLAKYHPATSNQEYLCYLEFSGGAKIYFQVSGNGTSDTSINSITDLGISLIASEWYFVVCWHDPVANIIGLSINEVSATKAHSAGCFNGVADFNIGAWNNGGTSGKHSGNIQYVGAWRRVLTSTERTELFNVGYGRSYSELTIAHKVSLISYWDLNELSGTRSDSHGTNHLADMNTVLWGNGLSTSDTIVSSARPLFYPHKNYLADSILPPDFETLNPNTFYAAGFNSGLNEYLTIDDNENLSRGDFDFTLSGWFYVAETDRTQTIVSKGDADSTYNKFEFIVEIDGTTRKAKFRVGNGSTHTATSANVVLQPYTWYFFVCEHDASDNLIGIRLNSGGINRVTHSGGSYDSAFPLMIAKPADIDVTITTPSTTETLNLEVNDNSIALISGRVAGWASVPTDSNENLITYSTDITNAAWNKATYPCSVSGVTVTATASAAKHGLYPAVSITPDIGMKVRQRIEVEYVNNQYIWVGEGNDVSWVGIIVDVQNGTITNVYQNVTAAKIEPRTGGGYVVSFEYVVQLASSRQAGVWFNNTASSSSPATYTPAGTEQFKLHNHTWQRAMYPNAHTLTTSAAVTGTIKTFTQATSGSRPCYTESQNLENLYTNSEVMGTLLSLTRSNTTANSAVAPDGASTADTLYDDGTGGSVSHAGTFASPSGGVVAGNTYRVSIYAKRKGTDARSLSLRSNFGGTGFALSYAHFDIINFVNNGSSGASIVQKIESVGNGWCRLIVEQVADLTTTSQNWAVMLFDTGTASAFYPGDGVSGVYVWGAQIQLIDADPTYLPTTSLPRFRGINGQRAMRFFGGQELSATTTLSSIFSDSAKILYVVARFNSQATGTSQEILLDSSAYFECRLPAAGTTLDFRNYDSNYDTASATVTINTPYIIRGRHSGGNLYIAIDSGNGFSSEVVAASGATGLLTGTLRLGGNSGSLYFNGDIAAILTWTDTVPDTELESRLREKYLVQRKQLNGKVSRLGMWDRLLTYEEHLHLYNLGAGRDYSSIHEDLKTGLISYWDLDEETGTRFDSYGENDLTSSADILDPTDINCIFDPEENVTVDDSNRVSSWGDDNSVLQNFVQSTANIRPYLTRSDNLENRIPYSEDLSDTTYVTYTRSTIAPSSISMSEVDLVSKFVEDSTATNTHLLTYLFGAGEGSTYRFSCFVKAGTKKYIRLAYDTVSYANFDLENGAIGETSTLITPKITPYDNDWYRIQITFAVTDETKKYVYLYLLDDERQTTYTGDGSKYIYLSGVQLNSSLADETYLKTTGSKQYRGQNGYPGIKFDGLEYMTSPSNFVDLFSENQKLLYLVFRTEYTGSSDKYILKESGDFFRLAINSTNIVAKNWDTALDTLTVPIASNATTIYRFRHENGKIFGSIDSGSGFTTDVEVVSGANPQLSGTISLGASAGASIFYGTIFSIITSRNLFSAPKIEQYLRKKYFVSSYGLPSVIKNKNLALWCKGERETGVSSFRISSWLDQSPNNLTFTDPGSTVRPYLSRTDNQGNYLIMSRNLSDGSWTKTNLAVVVDFTTNFDGSTTATKLTANAGTANHSANASTSWYRSSVGSPGKTYKYICYLKRSNYDYVWMGDGGDSLWHGTVFNLSTGTVVLNTNVASSSITSVGNGWYKCIIEFVSLSTSQNLVMYITFALAGTVSGSASTTLAGTEIILMGGAAIIENGWDETVLVTSGTVPEFPGINGKKSLVFLNTFNLPILQSTRTAALFTSANSESLSIADSSALSFGDTDFSIMGWVRIESTGADQYFVSKWNSTSTNQREYRLYFNNSTSLIRFGVSNDGTNETNITSSTIGFGTVTTSTWYFVVAWHDSVNNVIGLTINGTSGTSAHTTGMFNGSAPFQLGAASIPANTFLNGRLSNVSLWNRTLTTTEKTVFYNSGNALRYQDVPDFSGYKTSLLSWWNLDEASGTRYDKINLNHLTDNNTVTTATGPSYNPNETDFVNGNFHWFAVIKPITRVISRKYFIVHALTLDSASKPISGYAVYLSWNPTLERYRCVLKTVQDGVSTEIHSAIEIPFNQVSILEFKKFEDVGTIYLNGNPIGSGVLNNPTTPLKRFSISDATDYFQGYIPELLFYNESLTEDELFKIRTYLKEEWLTDPQEYTQNDSQQRNFTYVDFTEHAQTRLALSPHRQTSQLRNLRGSFWVAGFWVPEQSTDSMVLIQKGDDSSNVFGLRKTSGGYGEFFVTVDGTTTTTVQATNFGTTFNPNEKYFFYAEHIDFDRIGVSVNNDPLIYQSHAKGIYIIDRPINIGAINTTTTYSHGKVFKVCIGSGSLSESEREALYNGGQGLIYDDLPSGITEKLYAFWEMSEESLGLASTKRLNSIETVEPELVLDADDLTSDSWDLTATSAIIGFSPENMLPVDDDFETNWTQINGATTESNFIENPINENLDAARIIETVAAGSHELVSTDAVYCVNGLTYKFSVYVKSAGRDLTIKLPPALFSTTPTVNFDLTLGTVYSSSGTVDSSNIVGIGNDWYLCEVSAIADATGSSTLIKLCLAETPGVTSYTGDGNLGAYIYAPAFIETEHTTEDEETFLLAEDSTTGNHALSQSFNPISDLDDYILEQSPTLFLDPNYTTSDLENIIIQSEDITGSNWNIYRATRTANTVANPLTGTVTADTLTEDGTAANSHALEIATGIIVTGNSYSFSAYIKRAVGTRNVNIYLYSGFPANSFAYFDTSTGALVSAGAGLSSYSSEDAGSGWWRFTVTATATSNATTTPAYIYMASTGTITYNGDSTSALYVYGAHIRRASQLSTYVATTTLAKYAPTPTVDSVGRVGIIASRIGNVAFTQTTEANRPLLSNATRVENLLTYSEQIDNAAWTKYGASVSANSLANPIDGALTAETLIEDGSTGTHHVVQSPAIYAGIPYRFSFYAKAKERSRVYIAVGGSWSPSAGMHVNLSDGTITQTDSGSDWVGYVTDVGGGWYRIQTVGTSTASGTVNFYAILSNTLNNSSYTGDGVSGIYLYGMQMQRAEMYETYTATTAVPIYGSNTGKKMLVFDGSNDSMTSVSLASDILALAEKTTIVSALPFVTSGTHAIIMDTDGTVKYRIYIDTNLWATRNYDGSSDTQSSLTAVTNQLAVYGSVHDGTNIIAQLNTGANASTASGSTSSLGGTLRIGSGSATNYFNGPIGPIVVFNKVLSPEIYNTIVRGTVQHYLPYHQQTFDQHKLEFYVKPHGRSIVRLYLTGPGVNFRKGNIVITYTLTGSGTVSVSSYGGAIVPTIELVDDYYKCSLTYQMVVDGEFTTTIYLDNGSGISYAGSTNPSLDGYLGVFIKNISIKPVVPSERNIFPYPQQLDFGTTSQSTIYQNVELDPTYSLRNVDLLYETAANSTHLIYAPIAYVSAGETYRMTLKVKSYQRTACALRFDTGWAASSYAYFNLTGPVVHSVSGGVFNASITDIGGGWYQLSADCVAVTTSTLGYGSFYLSNTAGTISYTGTATPTHYGMYIHDFKLTLIDSETGVNNLRDPYTLSSFLDLEGFVASGEMVPTVQYSYPGYWLNEDGHLDTTKYLRDDYYYQEFSYALILDDSIDFYREYIKTLLHPAGTIMFGEFQYVNEISIDLETDIILDKEFSQSVLSLVSSIPTPQIGEPNIFVGVAIDLVSSLLEPTVSTGTGASSSAEVLSLTSSLPESSVYILSANEVLPFVMNITLQEPIASIPKIVSVDTFSIAVTLIEPTVTTVVDLDPSTLATVWAWWDADEDAYVDTYAGAPAGDGDDIEYVYSADGNGKRVLGVGPIKYRVNDADSNNNNCIDFNPTSEFVSHYLMSVPKGLKNNRSVITAVFSFRFELPFGDEGEDQQIFFMLTNDSTKTFIRVKADRSGGAGFRLYVASRRTSSDTLYTSTASSSFILSEDNWYTWIIEWDYTNNALYAYQNNKIVFNGDAISGSGGSTASNDAQSDGIIGSNSASDNPLRGKLGKAIIFTGALSADEKEHVNYVMAQHYGYSITPRDY